MITLEYRLNRAQRLRPGEDYNRILVPPDNNLFIDHILWWSHSTRSADHYGQNGTLVHCSGRFYWPRMIDVINQKMTLKQDELLVLKSYDFTLAHRAGRGNKDANCLSRSSHFFLADQTYHVISINKRTQPLFTTEARQPIYPDPEDEAEGIVDLD